jgi:hypothetical protein
MRGMNYQALDAVERQCRYQTRSSQVYVKIFHKAQRLRYQLKDMGYLISYQKRHVTNNKGESKKFKLASIKRFDTTWNSIKNRKAVVGRAFSIILITSPVNIRRISANNIRLASCSLKQDQTIKCKEIWR